VKRELLIVFSGWKFSVLRTLADMDVRAPIRQPRHPSTKALVEASQLGYLGGANLRLPT